MKTMRTWLATIAALLCSITASAHDFEVDGIYYNITSSIDLTVAVTYRGGSYSNYSNEYSGEVTIPSTVSYNDNTYSVTSIGANAFRKCSSLTSITVPDGVTSIGETVFGSCSRLTSITLPTSVTSIGSYVFANCSSLTSITIPDGLTSISSYVFHHCSSLTSITIPDGVTSIGASAFWECSSLTSITVPDGVTSIGAGAFNNCSSLTFINIPESVTSIGGSAFSGTPWYNNQLDGMVYISSVLYKYKGTMPANTTVEVREGAVSISRDAFSGCSSLTSITLPASVISIENGAFDGCANLKEVILEDGSATLTLGYNSYDRGEGLFSDCPLEQVYLGRNLSYSTEYEYGYSPFYGKTTLTSLTIGNGVTSIGSYAFSGCSSLTSITIPEGLTSIGTNAFKGCSIVRAIWKCAQLPSGYSGAKGKINYIADEKYASYSDFKVYPMLNSLFEVDGITYVPTSLSERTCDVIDCVSDSTMAQLAIGEKVSFKGVELKVKEVNPYTFYGNTHIKDATLNNLGAIGNYAFYGCTALSSLTLDNTITSVGSYAFEGCSQLASFTLPASVTSVGYAPFAGCDNLSSLSVDAGNSIYDSHDNCNGIVEKATNTLVAACNHTVIPESVTSIGDYAFSGCKNVTNLNILGKVRNIGSYAFNDCDALLEIELPNSVTAIGDYAFASCDTLQNVSLGDSVATIGKYAFNKCVKLQDISIPQSTTKIGDYAFYGCSSLSDVVIEDRTTALSLGSNGSSALFSSCPLDSVYIGGKITYSTSSSKGYSPFSKNTSLRTVTITDKEEKIYNYEFYGCTALTNVTIGNGVTSIGDNAFSGCSSLTGFSFGSSMKSIGASAFTGCSSIKKIVSSAVTPPVCGSLALDDINKWECVLRVPISYMDAYMAADQWKEFLFIEDVVKVERYALKFMVDGEVYHTDSLAYSESIVLPEPPIKEGHTFSGWSEIPETMPIFDVTVTGSFTINSYPVNYMVDGELYKTETIVYNDTIILADAPTKEGYTFSGWSEVPERMPADTVNVIGSFTINKYLVTFKIGDDVIAADSLEYGAAIIAPEVPEKEGHTFSGWSEIPATMPARDVTVSGSFTVNSYTVTYMVDGEVYKTESYAYGASVTAVESPVKEGHTFSGWNEIPTTMPAENITVTGSFTVNSYTITYMVDGEVYKTFQVAYGTEIPTVEVPSKEGYTFSGWSEIPATMPAEDVIFSGVFTINKYLVTFKIDGIVLAADSLEYGSVIIAPTVPEREGYTFSGWGEVAGTVPAHDVVYEGTYTANTYRVYYFVGATLVHTAEVAYGEAIPEYVYEPTEEGCTFLGWIGETYETMPAHDVTYTANIDDAIEQLTIVKSQLTIYDLKGRKVTDTENLKGGIYIVNGKKVVIE